MKYFIALSFFYLSLSPLFSQQEETLFNNTGLHLTGIWGSFGYNHSFVEGDGVFSRGGYGALEFNDKIIIGWSGFKSRERTDLEDIDNGYDLRYSGLIVAYSIKSYKAVHPRLTLLSASGKATDKFGERDGIFVLQPSAGIEINVFEWVKVGVEAGYRLVSNSDLPNISNSDLSAPFAQIDLRFGINW